MVAATLVVPQAGCSGLFQASTRCTKGLLQTRTETFQPSLVLHLSPSGRRSLSVRSASISNGKDASISYGKNDSMSYGKDASTSYRKESNDRPMKGIPYAEAAERRRKLNKPTPLGDQLGVATNEFLNVVAYPIGFGVLAVTLPLIWTTRLAFEIFSQPADMTDKVVLITGASSGIGEDMAYEYARLGARLALVARRKEKLEEVAANAWALGAHDVLVVESDLGDEEGCKHALSKTLDHYRRLDTLVNNAGLFPSFYFESANSTAGFDSIMDTNFWNYVYMTYHALPHLRASKGNIYVTASVSSIAPVPTNSFYNASKSAVASFFHTLRIELGDDVPITMFSPGLAKSEMTDGKFIQPDGSVADYEEGIRLRRQNGLGLVPLVPTSYIAKRAVDATRRKKPDVIDPVWYGLIAYYRLLAPELLDPLLRTFLVGKPYDNPVKSIQDAVGGGLGEPTMEQLRAGGMREPGQKDSVQSARGFSSQKISGESFPSVSSFVGGEKKGSGDPFAQLSSFVAKESKASVRPFPQMSSFVGRENGSNERRGRRLSEDRGRNDVLDQVLHEATKHLMRRVFFM